MTHSWSVGAEKMKKMLALSVLFHLSLFVLAMTIPVRWSPHRLNLPVYQVDLVSLPSSVNPPSVTVKESPASFEKPPVQKVKLLKTQKKPARPVVVAKKPPVKPPPKPIESPTVVPPPVTLREEASQKEPVPEGRSVIPPLTPSSEAVTTVPSPGTKIEVEVGVEVPDFKYPYYLDLIQRKVGMHWSPPPVEVTAEIKETVVGFVLFASGKIDEIKIEKSSEDAFFDQAALRAVYQANPLPPLPQEIRDQSLKVHFSFSLMKKG